ncbi:MAG: hypothetical protein H7318_14655 [Oligoflexus sp.]|nr:hypothetical protein [Oligoflexus sp.]
MVISDPSAEFIESQKSALTDFIFRVTGDRSRAGIITNEVCDHIHRDLMSSWTQDDIQVELFAYAYEINYDAQRGIERSFLETYFRNQYNDVLKVSVYYPLEILLQDMGIIRALTALLSYRYQFTHEQIARILGKSMEDVEEDFKAIAKKAKSQPRIKLQEMVNLPSYSFLTIPDYHPTAISHILVNMKSEPEPFNWRLPFYLVLVGLGLVVGYIAYLLFAT